MRYTNNANLGYAVEISREVVDEFVLEGFAPGFDCLLIHIENFIGPIMMELVNQQDTDALRSIRELIIDHLFPRVTDYISEKTGVFLIPVTLTGMMLIFPECLQAL